MGIKHTQEDYERQITLEAEAVSLGESRYNGERLEWHESDPNLGGEADGTPGKLLLKKNVDLVTERIVAFLEAAASPKAGRRHSALAYIARIEPAQAAFIALRTMVNGAAGGMKLTALAHNIGWVVRDHLHMEGMAKDHPGLYRKVSRQLARSTSAQHRLGVVRHVLDKYSLRTVEWSKKDLIFLGSALIDFVLESTDLFDVRWDREAGGKTPRYIAFKPETVEWLEKSHARCALLSPIHIPMVVPPRDWNSPFSGGYRTTLLRPRLIKSNNPAHGDELGGVDLTRVLNAVNAIQRTPWRINTKVLDVLEAEFEMGGASAGLPRRHPEALPPLPAGIPEGVPFKQLTAMQRESMTEWKGQAARVHVANAQAVRSRVTLCQKLWVARKYRSEQAIYFPHFIDFRGRVYPMAAYVNPQADDVGRGLLEFAEGKPLGDSGAYWLAVHIAGLFGVDKVSFEDRVKWVRENEDGLLNSVLDPHADEALWRTADSPFQALAACFEWAGYKLNGAAHVSHIPIAMDGSCSGLQHFSALLRDEIGGAAVNLVPSPQPADIYTTVAKRAQVLSDVSGSEYAPAWAGKVGRKIAKQPTMTLCYSATKYGMWKQIEGALRKLDEDGPYLAPEVDRFQASRHMSQVIWAALGETVVAARTAMDWLQEVAKVTAKAGIPLRWVSPIGLPVLQDYKTGRRETIAVFLGGKKMQLDLVTPTKKLASNKQAAGIAPNFVHSLDAAHLLNTVNLAGEFGLTSFAMIHDSFGVHACDTGLLNAVLREAFVEQYAAPVLENFRDYIAEQLEAVDPEAVALLPPLPAPGSLDLDAVKDSEFFFA